MEGNNHEIVGDRSPVPINPRDAAVLDIIRTETVLSRLPVHNLAKKGSISIQILKKTNTGEIELLWNISPSRDYGEPRQLAYKLDTIIINQRVDEAGRPLPKLLRLGSLNDICAELNMVAHAGQNSKALRRALLQNASVFITAKFNYRANDGTDRRLEAGFARYSVIFTGEKLPDGRKADAVYIVFNEPFWEVLNNAPVRPLDRAYMKELPPAAQRFYEIISRKIFAALKNDYPHAKISYSEYCTFSAQLRHLERQPVQDQMAKLLRPHKKSGYITGVRYEATIDEQNQPDWIMYLTPGPKAYAEFSIAHRTRKRNPLFTGLIKAGEQQFRREHADARQQRPRHEQAPPPVDPQLVAEFTRRGITEKKAHELLTHLAPQQDALAQLELGDQHIGKDPGKYTNPAGFYIHLVEENTPLPQGFETNAKRKAREEEEQRRDDERRAQQDLETEYEWYCSREIDRFIATIDPAEVAAVLETKRQENREKYSTSLLIDSFSQQDTKRELGKRAPLMTLEEFKARREQGAATFPEPASDLPAAEPATELVSAAPPSEEVVIEQPTAVTKPPAAENERGEVIQFSPVPATPSTISEPAIELASEPLQQEPGSGPIEPQVV